MTVGGPLKDEESGNIASFDRSDNTDDALHYMSYFTLDRLHLLVLNCNLCLEGGE